ncbi:allophanate hydrolase [Agaricicola taiwanensis]|uniref:Allophanate hydrolase n=1 Tax=Agaricicola taiwanensis TaxID=591372 RepID=A0A8J2YK19_9RHOB|nr:biotin-dependent carboxyltransferase family protein [Agaricicola taiwanensis]GGE48489.1 allophanate hydrolase [Agaricicola taiwanensis]
MSELLVLRPGPMVTLQDLGRVGLMHQGIPESGAMDPEALMLANLLAGNDPGEACLEFAMFAGVFRFTAAARLAVAGGTFRASCNGVPFPVGRSIDVPEGAEVEIGPADDATWGYLAISAGFAVEPVLGSRSTHVRFALGPIPRVLTAGDRLPLRLGTLQEGPRRRATQGRQPPQARAIRVVLGPQDDRFTDEAISTFLAGTYWLTAKFDRMACRLDGPRLAHRDGADIVSDGIAYGSIQVPGDGLPLVLLADRQTTGGYPKIATIIGADLYRLVQRRPGAPIRFVAITTEEAEAAWRRHVAARNTRLAAVRDLAPPSPASAAGMMIGP